MVPSSAVPYLAAIGLVVTELVVQTMEMLQSSRQSQLETRQEPKELKVPMPSTAQLRQELMVRLPEWSQTPVAKEARLLLVQMGLRERLPERELLVRPEQRELQEEQLEQHQV